MGASTTDGNANVEGRGSGIAQLSCLLWNLVSTLISSSICSLQLAASSLMHASPTRGRNSSSECEDEELAGGFALYQGRVWHERRHPVVHRFEYSVRYALVDLDKAPDWFQARTACHHMTADEARSIAGTNGTVHLLTVPASVGYEQNPLSVYYCYSNEQDAGRRLINCIAEVTNTPWAERVRFVFEPGQDQVPKPLHVSPFMDMLGTWRIQASQPTDKLQIVIGVQHPELGDYFCAKLKAERVEDDNPESFFWLMPHKVALWIYWQAALLIFKGVSFISHPKYKDGAAYRENARQRDVQLGISRRNVCTPSSGNGSQGSPERYFAWREAPCWPWK